MHRLAVAFMWDSSRTVCELRLDGQPSEALWTAAGVRWRGPWQAKGVSYAAGDAVAYGVLPSGAAAVWRAVGTPTGAPGTDAAWTPSALGEADLLALVAGRLVAENGGVPVTVRALEHAPSLRSSGVGGAGGPAGTTTGR